MAFHTELTSVAHHEALGVDPSADRLTVRQAYYRLAKRFHPDRHHRGHLSELQDKLEEVFVRVNEAYEAMRDGQYTPPQPAPAPQPEAASAGDEQAARQEKASSSFRDGRRRFDEGDFHSAIQAFRRAVHMDGGNADYHSYLGRTLAKNPRWRREAEENLLKAAELKPNEAENYAQLGLLYASANLPTKAERYFAEALKREPTNQTALAGRRPEAPKEKKKDKGGITGTFRNLFAEKRKDE